MLLIVLLMVPVLPVSVFAGEETAVAIQAVEDSGENLPAAEALEEATLVVAAPEENCLVVPSEDTLPEAEETLRQDELETQGTSEGDLAVEGQEAITQESEAVQPAQESSLKSSNGSVTINDLSVGSLEEIITRQGLNATEVITLTITGAGSLDAADLAYINTMSNLTVLDVADSVTVGVVEDGFLAKHDKITTVTLPATTFGASAFYNCVALTSVNLPSATSFGDGAFANCKALNSVNLPNATSFGAFVFYYCDALTSISLPKAITFGAEVFYKCNALTSVSLPSARTFDDDAFEDCKTLVSISLPKATTFGDDAFIFCKALTSVDLPNVTNFGDYAFNDCGGLISVSLPKATTFGDYAFDLCVGLISISLPKAETFGDWAFAYCAALINVDLPEVITFGGGAFYNCHALRSVDLPSATTFGDGAFVSCEVLSTVNVPLVTSFGKDLYYGTNQKVTMTLGNDSPTINAKTFANYQPEQYASIIQVPAAKVETYDQADGQLDGLWYGWIIEGICTVDYNAGDHGSINGVDSEDVIEGENPQNVPTVEADEGFTFIGWAEENETTIYTSEEVSQMAITSDQTFMAQYSQNIYTVQYDAGDHGSITGTDSESVIEGESPQNVPMPKADEGFTFIGWAESDETTIYTSEEVSQMAITSDQTFIAQYAEETATTTKDNPKTGVDFGIYIGDGSDAFNITPLLLSSLLLESVGFFLIIKKKKHI